MQKIITFLFVVIIAYSNSSCESKHQASDIESVFEILSDSLLDSEIECAKGFDLFEVPGIKKLVIYHPELGERVIATIYITDSLALGKYNIKASKNIIIAPVTNVAVFSATQLNAFEKLGLLERVSGVSEAKYIKSKTIIEKLETGEINELATNADYFIEKILTVSPSIIFYSPYKFTEKHPLEVTEITLIPFYDYFENEPLGRAEWIKFTAAFFNVDEEATQLFKEIEEKYLHFKDLVPEKESKPSVFSDKYFNGQWYIPGGKSYIASLFRDAGADYLWKNDFHTGSFPLDYEVVYSTAYEADFWRIVGSYSDEPTYSALLAENELYKHFKAFNKKQVIWCDAEKTAYFENSPLEPHLVLADLIFAFHPGLLPEYKPKYYHILK